jgi:hypothetical protein
MARPRGAGAHARARVLASQGRGVAVPCAGHRHPRPATQRGGRGGTVAAVSASGTKGPCTKAARQPDGGRGPRAGYGGIVGGLWLTPAAEGIGEAAVKLTGGLAGEVLGAVTGRCRRVGAVQGVRLRRKGVGLAELRRGGVVSSLRCSSSSSPSSSLLLVRRWRKGKQGAARVRGAAGALILGARVWEAAAAGGSRRPGRDAWRHRGGAARLRSRVAERGQAGRGAGR